jgi:DNA-binding NtrC family response regulator
MHFLGKFAERRGSLVAGITARAKEVLQSYAWPGNVRELANVIEHAVVVAAQSSIGYESLPDHLKNQSHTHLGSVPQGAGTDARLRDNPFANRLVPE